MSDLVRKPVWREIKEIQESATSTAEIIVRNAEARQRELSPLYQPNLWTNVYTSISEPYTGAWQHNVRLDRTNMLSFSAVFCCVTGIASDIAKNRIKLCREEDGIWVEITENSPWLPLLRKPNHYQICQKFVEQWILSKLLNGNTYVLKERDNRGIVNAMYVLDPYRVTPLIADNGAIFYELKQDNLSKVEEQIVIPASEIIHDSMPGLFHPLIGTSPLYACATSATVGATIQANSQTFFGNKSMPGGMLSAPGRISDETAARMKATFETNFGGANIGRLLVAGDGLEFKHFALTAEAAQLVEQLKWSVSDVARAFHYPEFKLGGPLPPYSGNMQALTLSYFTDCLQGLIESLEGHLDEGLELPARQGTEVDIDNLLRMDTMGQAEVATKLVGGGIMAPDDGRFKFNLKKVPGGPSPYLQQQNYSLEALAKRDAQADPFANNSTAKAEPETPNPKVAVMPARSAEDDDESIDEEMCESSALGEMMATI